MAVANKYTKRFGFYDFVLIDVLTKSYNVLFTFIYCFVSISMNNAGGACDAGRHVFYLYLLTPVGAPRSYIMKLPAMLQSTCFMDGLCDVYQPVELYTFTSVSVACITFTPKASTTTSVVFSYLHAISEWFQTLANHSRHIPANLTPNVDTMICSFTPLFDPVRAAWTLEMPVCESSLAFFRAKVFFVSCAFTAGCGSSEAEAPLAVSLYRDTCSSSTHDFRRRIPSFRRVHLQIHQPFNYADAAEGIENGVPQCAEKAQDADILDYDYNLNYNFFDEEFPPLDLLDSTVGIVEDALVMEIETTTGHEDITPSAKTPVLKEGIANTPVLKEGVIVQGNSIIYMCPVSEQFVQARVTHFTSSPFLLECEPPPLQPFNATTLVSLYDSTTQTLFGKLQILSVYSIVK